MQDDWFDEPKELEVDKLTAEQIEGMVNKCFEMKAAIKAKEKEVKEEKADLQCLQADVITYLKKFNKKKHVSEAGAFTLSQIESAKLPQGENKQKLFEFLQQREVFFDMVHMNSRTFNKQCKEWREEMREADPTWEVPGVTETIMTEKVTMTPAKG